MGQKSFQHLLLELTFEEQECIILCYRNYKVDIQGASKEAFGLDFDEKLRWAVKNHDKDKVLKAGVREIIGALKGFKSVPGREHFYAYFRQSLPERVCNIIFLHAGIG